MQALEDVKGRLAEKEEEVGLLRDEAQNAAKALEAAENERAEKEKSRDVAQSLYDEAAQKTKDAEETVEKDEAAVATAKDDVTSSESRVAEAQKAVDEATAALEAAKESTESATQQVAKGSVGFFEEMGSENAVLYLTDSETLEDNTGTRYSEHIHVDSAADASALDNVLESLNWIDYCNATYRLPNGLSELKVTDDIMASAQRNADFSTDSFQHASNMGEGYAENLTYAHLGKEAAFQGWYDEEKAVWDDLVAEDPSLEQYKYDSYELMVNDPETYGKVGHYLNIIDPSWEITGLAINTTDGSGAAIQQFAPSEGAATAYSVAEYRERFEQYYDTYVTAGTKVLEEAQAKKDEADSSLDEALAAREDAVGALSATEESLNISKSDLVSAQEAEGARLEDLNLAVDAVTASDAEVSKATEDYEAAKSASELGDSELEAIEEELAEKQGEADTAEASEVEARETVNALSGELSDATDLSNSKTVTVSIDQATYNGSEQEMTPLVTVRMPDETTITLSEGADYEVAYENNLNAGNARVVITGKGDSKNGTWWGETESSFTIAPKLINDELVVVDAIPECSYSGKLIEPKITIHDGGEALRNGADFIASYENNLTVGTATVTISGMGNYGGSREFEFQIVPVDLSQAQIAPIPAQVYTGRAICPKVTVLLDGTELPAEDYTVSYENNVRASTASAKVIVTGKGNCVGKLSTTFEIKQQNGKWVKSGSQWWYQWADKTYPTAQFLQIGKATYYFDKSGWMAVGWRQIEGKWYYFNSSGARVSGWQKINGTWYVFGKDGVMVTGWWKEGSITYYLKSSGAMATGWQKIAGDWYWFNPSGAMGVGWLKSGGNWYWLDSHSGKMMTGWLSFSGTYYYLKSSGAMATGWQMIGSKWFFFESSGAMAKSKWIQTWYYVGPGGAMVENGIADGYRIVDGKWDGRGRVA